jgi:hypothetical protein
MIKTDMKQALHFAIIFCLVWLFIWSEETSAPINREKIKEVVKLFPIRKNGKSGYINNSSYAGKA